MHVSEDDVVEIDAEEKSKLDGETHKIADDIAKRTNQTRKIDLAEDAGIVDESVAGFGQTVGKILPKANTGQIEQRLRQSVGRDLSNTSENDHIHDGRHHGLNQEPKRSEDGLLVLGDDVSFDEEHHKVAVAPDLAEIHAKQFVLRLDDRGPFLLCLYVLFHVFELLRPQKYCFFLTYANFDSIL